MGGGPVLPALGPAPEPEPAPAPRRLQAAAAADVPARLRPDRRVLRPRPPHLRARRSRQHLRLLPCQGSGAANPARRGPYALQLRRQLRRHRPGARPLRAPDPRRHGRRSDPVQQLRGNRAPLGGLPATLGGPAASDPVRARLLGTRGDRPPDRAAPLASPQRPRLSNLDRERKRAPSGALFSERTYHQRRSFPWLVGPRAFEVRPHKHRRIGKVAPVASTVATDPLDPPTGAAAS